MGRLQSYVTWRLPTYFPLLNNSKYVSGFRRRSFRKKQMAATAGGHLCDSSHGAPTPTGTQSAGDPAAT